MTQLTDTDEKYAAKVAKLIELANRPTTGQAEAENALAKAAEIMERYALSEAAIAIVQGLEVPDTIVREHITYSGIYHRVLFDIGDAVASSQGCKTLILLRPKTTRITIIGFSRDVERVKFLDASCQLQATRALATWWKAQGDVSWMTAMMKFKAKRTFLKGFAHGLDAKLTEARRVAHEGAIDDVSNRTGQTGAEARTSTELVLRSKQEKIDDWVDTTYGKLKTTTRRMSFGGMNAYGSGAVAGRRADVGQRNVGGTRRELS